MLLKIKVVEVTSISLVADHEHVGKSHLNAMLNNVTVKQNNNAGLIGSWEH